MKKIIPALFISLIMTVSLSPTVRAGDVIRVGGTGSGLGAMKALADAFEKAHPHTKLKVLPSLGSSGGIKALLDGALDVAVSARALKTEELKGGAVAVEFARTPFIFIANNTVNKADLTTRELEMILNGQLPKWPDGSRIRPILRPAADADTMIIKTISKEMEQAVAAFHARPNMLIAVTDQESADLVAKIPGAMGGSTLTQVETEKIPVKVLSFNGIMPSLDALDKGRYPLVKPLYVVTSPKTPAAAERFTQFVRSAKGRAILTKSGALPSGGDESKK